jgi:hypothetical protein
MDLRIVDQVDDRLRNEFSVALNGDIRLNGPAELPTVIIDGWDVHLAKFSYECREIHASEGSSNASALYFRDTKNGGEQGKHLIAPFDRRLQRGALRTCIFRTGKSPIELVAKPRERCP